MTLYEYIAVASSLVLSLSAVRLISGFSVVFQSPLRYWLHAALVAYILLIHALTFWGLWSYSTVEDWNAGRFLLFLTIPALTYANASFIIPSEPEIDTDWKVYFENNRLPFYWTAIGVVTMIAVNGVVTLGVPFFSPIRLYQLIIITVWLVAVLRPSERKDQIALTINVFFTVIAFATVLGSPAGPTR